MKLEIGGQRKIEGWTNMGQRDNNFNIIKNYHLRMNH